MQTRRDDGATYAGTFSASAELAIAADPGAAAARTHEASFIASPPSVCPEGAASPESTGPLPTIGAGSKSSHLGTTRTAEEQRVAQGFVIHRVRELEVWSAPLRSSARRLDQRHECRRQACHGHACIG